MYIKKTSYGPINIWRINLYDVRFLKVSKVLNRNYWGGAFINGVVDHFRLELCWGIATKGAYAQFMYLSERGHSFQSILPSSLSGDTNIRMADKFCTRGTLL